MQSVEDRVRQVMAGLFGVEPETVGPKTSMDTLENWDSLQHVSLVMALEQEFGMQIPVSEAFQMTDFNAVCRSVARHGSAG